MFLCGTVAVSIRHLQAACSRILHSKLSTLLTLQGNPDAPRCGFSQKVVSALQSIQVPFKTFDILSDEEVRQGLKEYSQWPTYPQLYVKGELLGGCDVILEMQQEGECDVSSADVLLSCGAMCCSVALQELHTATPCNSSEQQTAPLTHDATMAANVNSLQLEITDAAACSFK